MKRLSLLILICIFIISACEKEGEFVNAVILDGGDPALDGCGWLIEISSVSYKPQNLPDIFKVDSMEVEIKYNKLNTKADCGFAQDVFDEISLDEIKELNI